MHSPDENKIYFTKNGQIENEHFVTLVIRGIHEMEELKRAHELRVDEFSKRTLIENQDTIFEPTARIQELQHEVNCMNYCKDLKYAKSVRSGQLSHVPSQSALFRLPFEPGGMPSRDRNVQRDFWNPHVFSRSVFAGLHASASTPYAGILNSWDSAATGNIPVLTNTEKPVAESGDQSQDTVPSPRCPRLQPRIRSTRRRRDLKRIMGPTNNDFKSRNVTFINSLLRQHFRVGR